MLYVCLATSPGESWFSAGILWQSDNFLEGTRPFLLLESVYLNPFGYRGDQGWVGWYLRHLLQLWRWDCRHTWIQLTAGAEWEAPGAAQNLGQANATWLLTDPLWQPGGKGGMGPGSLLLPCDVLWLQSSHLVLEALSCLVVSKLRLVSEHCFPAQGAALLAAENCLG